MTLKVPLLVVFYLIYESTEAEQIGWDMFHTVRLGSLFSDHVKGLHGFQEQYRT